MVYHADNEGHWRWPAGHFSYSRDHTFIYLRLPARGLIAQCNLPILKATTPPPSGWCWDGNVMQPTIKPSIHFDPKNAHSECYWHGYVTAGVLAGIEEEIPDAA